jgi:RHS repeat-associated protein
LLVPFCLYSETYTYNQDGGIATKVRNGSTTSYAYVTGTHKLATAGSGSFTYDAKGNVTADGSSSVTLTSYDFRNLPLAITASGTNYTYKYNDGGNRIYKEGSSTKDYYLYDHTGRALLIYDMNTSNLKTANIYGSGLIGRVDLSGGATGGYYERMYYIKDHLGSIRVGISSVTTTNNNITYASDYYPFGETIREYTAGSNKYKFTEKERDNETSYDYFGARYYNNKLGVWLSVDPMSEKYHGWNPYNYVMGNPMLLIDVDGNVASDFYNKEGEHKHIDDNDNDAYLVSDEKLKTINTNNAESVKKEKGTTNLGSNDDLLALVRVVYNETRGEPDGAKMAIAFVLLNRSNSSGNSIKDEAQKPAQFTGVSKWNNLNIDNVSKKEKRSLSACYNAAIRSIVANKNGNIPIGNNVYHFYSPLNKDDRPYWHNAKKEIPLPSPYNSGNFIFYKDMAPYQHK